MSLRNLLLASALGILACAASAAEITTKMSLAEAIDAARADGLSIAYSTRLVQPWMRVRETPESTDTVTALKEVLGAYSLRLSEGPGGSWLVVQGEPKARALSAETTPEPVPAETAAAEKPELDEITIVASRYSLFERTATSDQFLTGEQIRLLPHIADDAFRAFHRVPGAAANDFSAPFNLRGGAVEEVKVVLDGLELFEPFHMRTLFNPLSIVDPGIIGNASILSGGFTAEYGNHMSGVIDIDSRWPEGEAVHEVGVSFVSSFARSSGQLSDRSSYQVAARRGYLDLLADTVTDEGEELKPRYTDVFGKLGIALSDATDISFQGLFASDDVDFADPADGQDFGGESTLSYAWVTLDYEPNDVLSSRTVLSFGSVDNDESGYQRDGPPENVERSYQRDVEVGGLQSDLTLHVSDSQLWMFGARYRTLDASYDYVIDSLRQSDFLNGGMPFVLQRDIDTSVDGDEIGVYARYRFRPSARQTWELGLRWDQQNYTNTDDDSQISPRVNALFQVSDRTNLRLGWGHYYQPQGIHELQVQDGIETFFPAEKAEHRVIGIRRQMGESFDLQLDLYQKKYSDLRPRFENALDPYEFAAESNFDRLRIEPESAEAVGAELTLQDRRNDNLDWWLNYTWSRAEDRIEGVDVPRSWDQRHAITGNLTWRGEKWRLSLVGRFHSGWPSTRLLFTPVVDSAGLTIGIDSDLSERNIDDFDDYLRLDARLTRTVDLRRGTFEYYFEIFNLLDTDNQCCIPDHDLTFDQTLTVTPNIDEFLPFFPSFGFVWTFGPGAN